jgi:hypothetical protein
MQLLQNLHYIIVLIVSPSSTLNREIVLYISRLSIIIIGLCYCVRLCAADIVMSS